MFKFFLLKGNLGESVLLFVWISQIMVNLKIKLKSHLHDYELKVNNNSNLN